MRMKEGKNIAQDVKLIKHGVSAIKAIGGVTQDSKIVSKVLRTLLHVYDIKFFVIQEVRAMIGNSLTLDGLVGQLTTFELRNYDNSMVIVGNSFKFSLIINDPKKEKKIKEESESKIEDGLERKKDLEY